MSDTRCANPAYQLDVDVMVLEYTLYYAIDAKLKAMRAKAHDEYEEPAERHEATAARLIESFDILVRLFHRNHPGVNMSQGTEYNIKILEFLVLFDLWEVITKATSSKEAQPPVPHSMGKQLGLKRIINNEIRRQHVVREADGGVRNFSDFDVWKRDLHAMELNDLMPCFMDLSAEMVCCLGSANQHWYELAAEFMLQCAIERASSICRKERGSGNTHAEQQDWVKECFAWSDHDYNNFDYNYMVNVAITYIDDLDPQIIIDAVEQQLQVERFVSELFAQSSPSPSETSPTNGAITSNGIRNTNAGEAMHWPSIRKRYQQKALRFLAESQRDGFTEDDLRTKLQISSLHGFLLRLGDFIDGLWRMNVDSISGKPVLVQIEEGRLEGMDHAEFASFLDRVGLKMVSKNSGDSSSSLNGGPRHQLKWLL